MTSEPRLRVGERWLGATAPIGRVSRTMALVAGASLLAHLAVVGTVAVAARAEIAPPTEIAVEIVHEIPKPKAEPAAPEPKKAASEPAKAEAAKPTPAPAKTATARSALAKSEPKEAELAKSKPAKSKPAKAELTKIAKAEPQVQPTPKTEHKIAAAPKVPPPPSREEAAEARGLETLKQELAALRAEQTQLQAERAAEAASSTPAAFTGSGFGALPAGFQAIALPGVTDGAGEAASYEAIVFSALAKAKGIGPRQGVPGTAGVRFSVDATGKLIAVELIQWSGIPDLDAEALAIVRRAVFPQPPQGAQRTFVANVNFEVDRRR